MCVCVGVFEIGLEWDISAVSLIHCAYVYAKNNQTMQMLILTPLAFRPWLMMALRGVEYYQMYVGSEWVAD